MKRIAVLMTVHNRREKTLRSLKCLYANIVPEGYGVEAYLTDDGCTDGTPEAVSERFTGVHIIKGDGNLYWNRGMWTAWNEAAKEDYDFYLWLNDDTYLYQTALLSIMNVSSLKNNAIIVGATENAEKTEITYGGYVDNKKQTPRGEVVAVDHFNGNVVLIPRKVFQELGNLDYYFRHSKGDFDYGMRAAAAGINIYLVGEVVGICERNTSLGNWCNPKLGVMDRLRCLKEPTGMNPFEFYYFDKKHKGRLLASFHVITIYLHCFFPRLWKK